MKSWQVVRAFFLGNAAIKTANYFGVYNSDIWQIGAPYAVADARLHYMIVDRKRLWGAHKPAFEFSPPAELMLAVSKKFYRSVALF